MTTATGPGSKRVAVLGAGSWGTALAILLAHNGHDVRLWGHLPQEIEALARARENTAFLPGIPLPDSITPLADLHFFLFSLDFLIFASVLYWISAIG